MMQITALLFQGSKQRLIQKRHLAQQKIVQLEHQLELVTKECDRHNPQLRSLKARLQAERDKCLMELQQTESTQASARWSGGDRLHQSGLPP